LSIHSVDRNPAGGGGAKDGVNARKVVGVDVVVGVGMGVVVVGILVVFVETRIDGIADSILFLDK
jgi:hypothetical protein